MKSCFICNKELQNGSKTQVCSSTLPITNEPFSEKIAEIVGEEFVIIITPEDYTCDKCTSLLKFIDKTENKLNLIRNALLFYVQKKYDALPAAQPNTNLDVVNGDEKTETPGNSINHPPTKLKSKKKKSYKMPKIYTCAFCTLESKDLEIVRLHVRRHIKEKKQLKKAELMKKAAQNTISKTKKPSFRCQLCYTIFSTRESCVDHVKKVHNLLTGSSNKKNPEETPQGSTKVVNVEVPKHEIKLQTESPAKAVVNHLDVKCAVDMDKLTNTSSEKAVVDDQEDLLFEFPDDFNMSLEDLLFWDQDLKTGDYEDIDSLLATIDSF